MLVTVRITTSRLVVSSDMGAILYTPINQSKKTYDIARRVFNEGQLYNLDKVGTVLDYLKKYTRARPNSEFYNEWLDNRAKKARAMLGVKDES